MNKALRIAFHEFYKHASKPSFIIGTLFIPFFAVFLTVMTVMLENNSSGKISLFDNDTEKTEEEMKEEDEDTDKEKDAEDEEEEDEEEEPDLFGYVDYAGVIITGTNFFSSTLVAFPTEDSARDALANNEIAAYYVLPEDYLETGDMVRYTEKRNFLSTDTDRWIFSRLLRINLLQDVDTRIQKLLSDPYNFEIVRINEDGTPYQGRFLVYDKMDDESPVIFLPIIFGVFLYVSIFSSAGLLQNSVIEEKENRMLEILLTSINPWQMLSGKILGLGTLGLSQVFIWVITFLGLARYHEFNMDLLQKAALPTYVWLLIIPYYLLGYLVYGGLMAGIGATMNSTRESSVLTMLISIPILVPFLMLFVIIDKPDGWVALLLSIFPYSASITMIIRLTIMDVPWWQIALSLLLLAGSVVFSIKAAAKLFHTTIMLRGKKFKIREVWKILRTPSV